MAHRLWIVFGLVGLMSGYTAAQMSPATQVGPGYVDPRPVLEAARKAIGTDNLRCVTISGTAYDGAVGQFKLAEKNVDWPRIDALANYTRTMNWETWTMKEEFDRKPGLNPAMWKYGVGWIDGAPLQQNQHQIFMVNGNYGWYMDGPGSKPVAVPPDIAEIWPIELYLNPHGFLKAAAMPGANPKAVWRWELGEMGRDGPTTVPEKMTVVSISVLGKYRVDATINRQNMLQRIHTWVPNPILGDMNYEHEFTNGSYVDVGNGIKFPTGWHSHQGWDDNFQAQSITAGHNAFGGTMKDVNPNVTPSRFQIPCGRQPSRSPWKRKSWPTACICWAGRHTTASLSSSTISWLSSRRPSTRSATWLRLKKSSKSSPTSRFASWSIRISILTMPVDSERICISVRPSSRTGKIWNSTPTMF